MSGSLCFHLLIEGGGGTDTGWKRGFDRGGDGNASFSLSCFLLILQMRNQCDVLPGSSARNPFLLRQDCSRHRWTEASLPVILKLGLFAFLLLFFLSATLLPLPRSLPLSYHFYLSLSLCLSPSGLSKQDEVVLISGLFIIVGAVACAASLALFFQIASPHICVFRSDAAPVV